MNKDIADRLERTEIELGEYKEVLGDQFPIFLNGVLVGRLMQLEREFKFLKAYDFGDV